MIDSMNHCLHCGGNGHIILTEQQTWKVTCTSCGCGTGDHRSEEEAVQCWNQCYAVDRKSTGWQNIMYKKLLHGRERKNV